MIGTRSEQNYSHITDFEIRRGNQDFRRQNISMSRLSLDLTTIGMNTTNRKILPIDSIPMRTTIPEPTPQTRPTKPLTRPEESSTQPTDSSRNRGQTHHCQTHHLENLILWMISIAVNPKERNEIQRKISVDTRNKTCQTHRRAILIFLETVTTDASDRKIRRATGKMVLSNYAQG